MAKTLNYDFPDVRENGTVEGHVVETHYQQIQEINVVEDVDGVKYAAFTSDGPGYDVQTRVSFMALEALLARS